MSALLAALSGAALVGGVLLLITGLIPVAERTPRATTRSWWPRTWRAGGSPPGRAGWLRRAQLVLSAVGGVGVWLWTGWLVAGVVVALAVLGVPWLLRPGASSAAQISRLEALEEWTRNLAGTLTVGVGLEQAMTATLRSTPTAIGAEVAMLVARLGARWPTEAALRRFADDLDDPAGDLVAAALLLGADRRGPGLASVLEGLAATVAEEVAVRRKVEADRSKPRSTARLVTFITLGVLAVGSLNTDYIRPYGDALGQLVLATLLSAYVGALLWLRSFSFGKPEPRFLSVERAGQVPR